MGRIFEVRKHTMFARWNRMAKQFARIGKDITIAVKAGGPDPDTNPALRRVIQNARAVNMPKDKVEAAIKRASGKDATNYERDPLRRLRAARRRRPRRNRDRQPDAHGRQRAHHLHRSTAATSRTTGSVASCSSKMGVFRLNPEGIDQDDLELVPDRPRPRGDGREHRREGRAADRDPLRCSPTSASCRRRSRTAASRRSRPSTNTSAPRRPSCPRRRRPKCSS